VTGKEFVTWMRQRKIRVAEVAFHTGLDTNTIYSFRRGESVSRSTITLINHYVADYEAKRIEKVAVS
jgi:uncharacterized protein YbgA (DUF1722 family)